MPKILAFVPCEKVIVSQQDNTTSLISLIEGFSIDIPQGVELAEDASIQMKWYVFSLWEKVVGEEEQRFEQRIELILPDGKKALDMATLIEFEPEPKRFRQVTTVMGFPISPAGPCALKLSLRELGQGNWREVADCSIHIIRPTQPQTG